MARARKPPPAPKRVKLYHAGLGFLEPVNQAETPQAFLAALHRYIDEERPREVWIETTAGDFVRWESIVAIVPLDEEAPPA